MTTPTDLAFPVNEQQPDGYGGKQLCDTLHFGLSKRELFAAMALQGILANPESLLAPDANAYEWAANAADALIEQLNKTEDK